MPIFNDAAFDTALQNDFVVIVNEIVDEILKEIQDSMIREVYDPWSPTYIRLFDHGGLFDSYIKREAKMNPSSLGLSIEGKVDQDTDRMVNEPENFIHGSFFYQTDDVRSFLTQLVVEGRSGPLFGDGFWTQPRDFYQPVIDWLDNGEFDKKIKNKMIIRGMKVM